MTFRANNIPGYILSDIFITFIFRLQIFCTGISSKHQSCIQNYIIYKSDNPTFHFQQQVIQNCTLLDRQVASFFIGWGGVCPMPFLEVIFHFDKLNVSYLSDPKQEICTYEFNAFYMTYLYKSSLPKRAMCTVYTYRW